MITLGIDASNLRGGGGVTHLKELLSFARPAEAGIDNIIVWGGKTTLDWMPDRPWLALKHQPVLDQPQPARFLWQQRTLSKLAAEACDLLFVPGGTYLGTFRPFVAMSQTMLPYDDRAIRRYGFSLKALKFLFIRRTQLQTFRQADGIIFLNKYAQAVIDRYLPMSEKSVRVIPHGIHERFFQPPRNQLESGEYSFSRPWRVLYVSHIEQYKHQWQVIEAVAKLRKKGMPITLQLVGMMSNAEKLLLKSLARFDPEREFVRVTGEIPFSRIHQVYQGADVFVFASSVENLPITLLEAMASGLPIACSDRDPMPDVLGEAGVYFNPENPEEIAHSLQTLLDDPGLRARIAQAGYKKAKAYSWEQCARETLAFLTQIDSRNQYR